MKFKILFIIFFFNLSCSSQLTTLNLKNPYNAKGFAYIYNDIDYENKVINGKMSNDIMQISHQNLKTVTMLKIINPKNKESLVLKNVKRIKYPEFYKILITKPVATKLNLSNDLPVLEIIEIRKNKSFVAKKQKFLMKKRKYLQKHLLHLLKFLTYQKIK